MYDVIIIGGGPAGLTAGIYTRRAGLKTLILEKETIGGQISSSPKVENYPGFVSISGAELSNNLFEQVTNLGADFEIDEALKIEDGIPKKVITESNTYETKAIIIATGAKYRLLNLKNEQELIGKGIHFCTTCDGAFYKNKIVAVIGGANTAVTNAIYMAGIAKKVYLIYRKDKLRCEEKLIKELEKINNIEVLYNTIPTKIIGKDSLESIDIITSGKENNLKLDGMFLSVGMDAETKIADNLITKNDQNYILSKECFTNKEGIFVAGDAREKEIRQLTTATADGTIAATNVINYLKTLN
jgi:thioredoxin reductase (NADPH)